MGRQESSDILRLKRDKILNMYLKMWYYQEILSMKDIKNVLNI